MRPTTSIQRLGLLTLSSFAAVLATSSSQAQWNSKGPDGADVKLVAVDPTASDRVYIHVRGRGIFRTTDGGLSWSAVNDGILNPTYRTVTTFAFNATQSPAEPWIGTNGEGVLRLGPSGQSWIPKGFAGQSTWVATARNVSNLAYAVVYEYANDIPSFSLHKTVDNGSSWSELALPQLQYPMEYGQLIRVSPSDPDTVFLQVVLRLPTGSPDVRLLKTIDGGGTWAVLSPVFNYQGSSSRSIYDLAVHPTDPGILLAGTDLGFFRSVDGGLDWTPYNQTLNCDSAPLWNCVTRIYRLAIDSDNPDVVYAAGSYSHYDAVDHLYHSVDGGLTWSADQPPSLRSPIVDLAIDTLASKVYAVQYKGGLIESPIGAQPWVTLGIGDSDVTSFVADPSNSATFYLSASGRGAYKSTTNGDSWTPLTNGMPADDVRSLTTNGPNRLYALTSRYVLRSSDGGTSWGPVWVGYASQIAASPNTTGVAYIVNSGGIVRSMDGGDHWSPASSGLPPYPSQPSLVRVSPTNPQLAYVIASTPPNWGWTLYRTTDAGEAWVATTLSDAGGALERPFDVVIDPADNIYVILAKRIRKSVDGGNSWTDIDPSSFIALSYWFHSGFGIDASDLNVLYLGVYPWGRLLRSTNGGDTWAPFGDSLPSYPRSYVWDLSIRADGNSLHVGTRGGGVFEYAGALSDTFHVNDPQDEADDSPGDGRCESPSGSCTLRAAVQEANGTPGPNTIKLAHATYFLTIPGAGENAAATGDLDITDPLTIEGLNPSASRIFAIQSDRIFDVQLGAGSLDLLNLMVSGGNADSGGAIKAEMLAGERLTLNGVEVSDSVTSGGGGGIWAQGPGEVAILNSTIAGNRALGGDGGGIQLIFTQAASLRNVTVSGNSTTYAGGGIMLFSAGDVHVNNSTIVYNSADAAAGGIKATQQSQGGGSFEVLNSALLLNTSPTNADCYFDGSSTLTSFGFNGISSSAAGTCPGWTPDDVVYGGSSPGIAPLGRYQGGPYTHALLPGSFLINAANPTDPGVGPGCLPYDARGVIRADNPTVGRCDIGAFEVDNPNSAGGGTVGTAGGVVATNDGAAKVTIPPSALAADRTIVVSSGGTSEFGLGADGTEVAVVANFGPENVSFAVPVTIALRWPDADGDGVVDGTGVRAEAMLVWRNGQAIRAACGNYAGAGCGAVACCDLVNKEFRFQVNQFSEYAFGNACGNGLVDLGEDCDQGSLERPGCCTDACTFAETGTTCEIQGLSAIGSCQASGVCGELRACGPCEEPNPAGGCRARVEATCSPAVRGKSKVTVRPSILPIRQSVSWTWKNVEIVAKADFGSPASTTDFVACVFEGQPDGTHRARIQATISAGGNCGTKPCWSEGTNGFQYKNKATNADGIDKLLIKSGAAGKATLGLLAKGSSVEMEPPPYSGPVTIQVRRLDNNACWTATYSAPSKNDTRQYTAKSD